MLLHVRGNHPVEAMKIGGCVCVMAVSFSLGNRKRSSPWCIFLLLLIGRNNRELCFLGEHCRFSRESVGDVFPGVCGGYPWTEHCLPGGAEREGWHGFINTVIVHVVRR